MKRPFVLRTFTRIRLCFLPLLSVLFVACSPDINPDPKVIGKPETETFLALQTKISTDMMSQFQGNSYESEKILPRESAETVEIGIPNGVVYTFYKDNSKYIKGDLNNDKLTDLIISADLVESTGPENMKYFVFLQKDDAYEYFTEFKADDVVARFSSRMNFSRGLFVLKSIENGQLVGSSKFHAGNEDYFRDYSYSFETERYKLNTKTKEIEFVSHTDLLWKNEKTGTTEKADTTKINS